MYERPAIRDLGSIAAHTFTTPNGNVKGGGQVFHLDCFAEQSSGTAEDVVGGCNAG